MLTSLSKLRMEEKRNYFTGITYRIIINVKWFSNYKSAQTLFKTKKQGTQKLFHRHYIQHGHEGKDDWQFKIIDQCTTNGKLRKSEVYWQHHLKTFFQVR